MAKFDILIVDIQDVGLRYYTYYATMCRLMDVCAEYHKKVLILDRPNPNGHYVDGPILDMRMTSENEMELSWQSVDDPLEPTAKAEKYIVYTRIGDGDFDNGVVVDKNTYRTNVPAGVVCSYKVTALNKGGESFPSEILSTGRAFNSKGTVLVVNGFNRISAPADFVAAAPADTLLAGFLDDLDHAGYIDATKQVQRTEKIRY